MSATGRNLPGNERHEHDFYETPAWCVEAIKPHLSPSSYGFVLDAGAGKGAIMRHFGAAMGVDLNRGELGNGYCDGRIYRRDFLTLEGRWDLVISNPPYNQALEFVQHALPLAPTVAFLLRLNWLEGKARKTFHQAHPADVYVLSKRPSFTGKGTDATAYAWFVWREHRTGGHWSVL